MQSLVFATNNPHKAREIEHMLGGAYQIKTLQDIGCQEEIEETEGTLEGNALLKARFVREKFGFDCFSEDTGLEVDALGGAPGVHTARFAGAAKDPDANIRLLLERLKDQTNRQARFRTVIAIVANGKEVLLDGVCTGRIAFEKQGTGGFGYDPVFIPDGYDQTFAALGEAVKNRVSHRAKATEKLRQYLIDVKE